MYAGNTKHIAFVMKGNKLLIISHTGWVCRERNAIAGYVLIVTLRYSLDRYSMDTVHEELWYPII